jgi:hypothetical protein
MPSRLFYGLLAAFSITFLNPERSWSQSETIETLPPIEIKAFENVDEDLFLLRVIENTYNNWPRSSDTSVVAASWAVDQRLFLNRITENARKKKLDADVISMLEACANLFRTFDDYLVEIGAVERAALDRAQEHRGKLLQEGAGRLVDRAIDNLGEKDAGKTIVSETAGDVIVGFVVDLFQQADRDAAKKRSIEYAQARYEQTCRSARAEAAAAARRIAKRKQWAAGEVGFENVPFADQLKRRPRDPFVRAGAALIRVKNETAEDLMRDARVCVEAADLVPDDVVYDAYRATFLSFAGDLAERAAMNEWANDSQHLYGTALAKEAVRICRTRLLHDSDTTDWGKYDLALALNFAGLHGDALAIATKAEKLRRNPGFAYNYSCLLSMSGQTRTALEWLESSFKLGNSGVSWAKQDPELAQLRRDHTDEFTRATEVKWEWKIVYGFFNDDIVLTNNSLFPLTDITLTPTIKKNGQTFTRPLSVRYLAAGQSWTWENVFSIPSGGADSSVATLICSQAK